MTRTRIVVQEHVARIKNARNMHELISEEIPEEKPMLADNQHSEEDVNYLLLSEEPPNDKYVNYTVCWKIINKLLAPLQGPHKFWIKQEIHHSAVKSASECLKPNWA